MKEKIGVLLVNLGTPDSPKTSDVRKYLREFLSDERVIDIGAFQRYLLVNLIIAPFRAPKSAHEYKKLWDEKGSPLLYHGVEVEKMLKERMDTDQFYIRLAMRYQSPSIDDALEDMRKADLKKLIVFPFFPQYASASTGSVHQKVMETVSKWQIIPEIQLIDAYPSNEKMISVFAEQAKAYREKESFDHILFSYHSLPERQILKGDGTGKCLTDGCCSTFHEGNRLCYRAQCYETSRKLVDAMGLKEGEYSTCFQSRLGKSPWIQPYTVDMIDDIAKIGKKRVLVLSPSFVADCLETTVEIGEEYKEVFEEKGGERWQMVESLNDNPKWVDAIKEMILERV